MRDESKIVQLVPAVGWWNGFKQDDGQIVWSACPAFALTSGGDMVAMDFSDGYADRADAAVNYHDTKFSPEGPPSQEEPAQ